MKYIGIIVFLMLNALASFAQDYQREINEQVWKPFLKASNEFDGEGFMAIQSKDLIRVGIDDKVIHGYSKYEEGILPGFKRLREEGKVVRTTEVRFIERITSADLSYETGYFKSVTRLSSGELRTRYTRFYFILRKESSVWKILVDSDARGTDVTEEMFQSAQPLE